MDYAQLAKDEKFMEILHLADQAYPDNTLTRVFDYFKKGGNKPYEILGDGLAVFIVAELADTYDNKAETTSQLGVAHNAMMVAAREIASVADAMQSQLDKTDEESTPDIVSIVVQ